MKVFVTGGSGYSGLNACLELAAHGHSVTTLSRDPDQERCKWLRRHQVDVREGSFSNADDYAALVDETEVVIHNVMDFEDPQGSEEQLFEVLGNAAILRGGRRRLVYTTGCSIYGPRPEAVMDENTPGNPDHALYFRMEMEKKAFAISDLGVVVLRPGFMYGNSGQSCQATGWFEMGEKNKAVYHGDPDKGWSWVHVNDLARAFRLAAEADRGVEGEVYCIADECRPTCVEVMRAALKATGYKGEIDFQPPSEDDLGSTWFNQNEFITSGKARRYLGWVPHHTGVIDEMDALYAAWKEAQS